MRRQEAEGFATPEEAARGDIPPRYARAIAVDIAPWGAHAVVLLATNEPPQLYYYQEICWQKAGRWFGGFGNNTPTSNVWFEGVRVATDWSDTPLPTVVKSVVVLYEGHEYEVPAVDGMYLFAFWKGNVPEATAETAPEAPRVIRLVYSEE
jgi:hypothetical protein